MHGSASLDIRVGRQVATHQIRPKSWGKDAALRPRLSLLTLGIICKQQAELPLSSVPGLVRDKDSTIHNREQSSLSCLIIPSFVPRCAKSRAILLLASLVVTTEAHYEFSRARRSESSLFLHYRGVRCLGWWCVKRGTSDAYAWDSSLLG